MSKTGRNDPCPCGSGKKYKKCCLKKMTASVSSLTWQKMRRTEGELADILIAHAQKYYTLDVLTEAWREFMVWTHTDIPKNPGLDFETIFMPWFLYNWIPDNEDLEGDYNLPEMSIAMHYLNKRGQKIDSFERRFIEEVCSQPFSFFLVTDVDPGKKLFLKDLLLQREIEVHERTGSKAEAKNTILFARIMTMDNHSIILGNSTTGIPPSYLHYFIDLRESFNEQGETLDKEVLLEDDLEIREIFLDICEELDNPQLPQLRNADGDKLEPTKLYYTLNCSPYEAVVRLASLSFGHTDDIISDGKFNKQGELQSIIFPWLKKTKDNTVLGDITIDGDQLIIGVNSRERAETIKRKITRRLGKLALFQHATIESLEKLLEDQQNNPPANLNSHQQEHQELMQSPEVEAFLKEKAEQHWKDWIDTPLPALKNQTPREAAKTKIGRERLEALFIQFERHDQQGPQPFAPDLKKLRQSIGMD